MSGDDPRVRVGAPVAKELVCLEHGQQVGVDVKRAVAIHLLVVVSRVGSEDDRAGRLCHVGDHLGGAAAADRSDGDARRRIHRPVDEVDAPGKFKIPDRAYVLWRGGVSDRPTLAARCFG